jgi:type I restriction enzyme S subunit
LISYREQAFHETTIGRFPKDWKIVRIGDVAEINSRSIDPEKKLTDSEFTYIDIESVESGSGIIRNPKKILGKDAPSRARRVILENDIIMSTVRPYLKAFALVPKNYSGQVSSTGFAVLTCKKEIIPYYLLSALFSEIVISQCNRMMVGGQYPALNSSQVSNILVPLPPLAEQQGISKVLSIVDLAIQKTDDVIAKTERLKKGLMQELLTKGIGHKEFKDTEIGKIPKIWEVKTLINAIGGKNDLIVAGPFGSNLKVVDYRNKGVPIIRLQNIDYGRFVDKDIKYTSLEKAEELSYHSFVKGDIVLAKLGDPIGKTCIIPDYLKKGIVVADVVRIRVDEESTDKKYVMYILNSFHVFNQLNRGIIGTTRPRVNLNQIRNLLIPISPLPEQHRIAETLSSVDNKLDLERNQKAKLERIKQGLMDLLLTGKIRVKVD